MSYNKPEETGQGLGQKAGSQVRVLLRGPTRTRVLSVYRADLNHPVNLAEHGNAANPVRPRDRADLTARRVRGHSIGRTEEANAIGNALDRPTSVWSEMARAQAEPPTNRRKQMTTDACRLMRPGVVAPRSTTPSGCLSVLPSCPLIGQRVVPYLVRGMAL